MHDSDGIEHTAPVWAVFGDLMSGLLGAFVLILVAVLGVQLAAMSKTGLPKSCRSSIPATAALEPHRSGKTKTQTEGQLWLLGQWRQRPVLTLTVDSFGHCAGTGKNGANVRSRHDD